MTVRSATVDDAAALAAVHVRTWREAYRGQVPQEHLDQLDETRRRLRWQQAIQNNRPPEDTLVLEPGSKSIVGFVHLSPSRDADTDPESVGEIQAIYVSPDHWARGAGRLLMQAALLRLEEAGYHQAILWVLRTNTRARRFYEAGGWHLDGTEKTDHSRGFPLGEVRYRYTRMTGTT